VSSVAAVISLAPEDGGSLFEVGVLLVEASHRRREPLVLADLALDIVAQSAVADPAANPL